MYVKLFQKILDSTINETDLPTRWTWITCMLLADEEGYFTATPQAIARRANLSIADVEAGLKILTAPDTASTTTTDNGRRLIQTSPNTWQVVNYEHYRRIASREDDRIAARERMRIKREAEKANESSDVRFCSDSFDSVRSRSKCSASEAEAEAEADNIEQCPVTKTCPGPTLDNSDKQDKVKTSQASHITLDRATWRVEGITDADRARWHDAAPLVDVDREILKFQNWCMANSDRAPRTRIMAAITRWMNIAQERAARNPNARPKTFKFSLPPEDQSPTPKQPQTWDREQIEREANELYERMRRHHGANPLEA